MGTSGYTVVKRRRRVKLENERDFLCSAVKNFNIGRSIKILFLVIAASINLDPFLPSQIESGNYEMNNSPI